MENTVYILDSYGLIYRAYFALMNHPLTNFNGENISSVHIFFKNLKALIAKEKPAFLAAAFDSRTPTFRHKMYAEYKANRAKTPEDLHAQVPWIEEILEGLGVPVLRADGYEADDIIATVAKKCEEEGKGCRILSGDKDLLQLVNDSCKEMTPDKANGGWETNGIEEVIAKWGIGPEKILDYLSLVGDSADNVPGVKGVGDKTALKLLNEYDTLDGIYEHAEEIKGALGEKIRGDREMAYFSKKLITLDDNVPVNIDFNEFSTANLNYGKAAELLKKRGAVSMAKLYAADAKPGDLENTGNPGLFENLEDSPAEKKAVVSSKISSGTASVSAAFDLTSETGELKKNEGNYSPCTKLMELTAFVDAVLAGEEKTVAFDTETDGLNTQTASLIGFSLCSKEGTAIYVPVVLPGDMFALATIDKSDSIAQLSRLFNCPEVTVVMHNGKFDLEVLATNSMVFDKENPDSICPACKIFDTMVAAWLLNPSQEGKGVLSLENLSEKLLGLKGIEFDEIVPKGKTFADLDIDTAFPYGAEDADFTFKLWKILKTKIEEAGLNELFYNMEMPVLPILADMEQTGIHLDKAALHSYAEELTSLIEEKEKQIFESAGHEFNIASTKQLQTVLFEEKGFQTGKKTKTGYSTDTAVLEELASSTEDPLPQLILDWRSYTKLQSTYVEALPLLTDKNSRIHTSFLQTGTATGRLSSRDPNLQNIPVRDENGRRIRAAFTSAKDKVFISADYSQIELCVLAHLSGDSNLCKSFIEGIDVHKATAALIAGISPDDVSPQQRRAAKTVNFGVVYGLSAFGLAKDLGISRTEAKNFIDSYFATYSGVRNFISQTVIDAQSNGYIETITGRRRYIPEINSSNKIVQNSAQRIAVNSPIQGSAADIVKRAMIDINDAIKNSSLKGKLKMLLQVHDELIFECDDNETCVNEALALIKDKMEKAFSLSVPLRVSIEHGKSWGEFH